MSRQASQLSFIFLSILILESLAGIVLAGDMSGNVCRTCHMKTIERDFSKQYLHPPFSEEKCTLCHLVENDSVQNESTGGINFPPVVSWFGIYSSPDYIHRIKLSHLKPGHTLLIEAHSPKLPLGKMEVRVPDFSTMSPVVHDINPPVLSDIAVDEVDRAVLISAVISWKTDELASSTVRYANGKLEKSFHDDGHFSKNHEIRISALRADTIYTYKVISEDMFGNVTTSQTHTFSTKQFFSAAKRAVIREPAEIVITHDFLKIDDDALMLELSANSPVTISIGYYTGSQSGQTTIHTNSEGIRPSGEHVQLSGKEWINISLCYTCHEVMKGPMSHPVNVLPSGGMVIPPEYPTLPDGRISCMSCHLNHAANLEYRLLKPSKRKLCVGCHKDMA